MSPETTRRRTAIVGLFVLFAVLVFVGGLFAVGSLQQMLTSRIHTQATFAQVDGLHEGDAVWYAGVPVGQVRGVSLESGGVTVDLALDRSAQDFIPGDVRARVGSDGLIGNAIVVLERQGTGPAEPIEDGAHLPTSRSASMEELMASLQDTNENLLAITDSVRRVTDRMDEGQGTLGKLAYDDALYEDVRATVETLGLASEDVAEMVATGRSLTRAANQPGSLAYDLAHDNTTYARLQGVVTDVEGTADEAHAAVAQMNQALTEENTPLGVMLADEEAGDDLGDTFDHLASSTEKLDESLEAMRGNWLFGPLFTTKEQRREARQEKREARQAARQADSDEGDALVTTD